MALWLSWLERHPVTVEVTSSNLVRVVQLDLICYYLVCYEWFKEGKNDSKHDSG